MYASIDLCDLFRISYLSHMHSDLAVQWLCPIAFKAILKAQYQGKNVGLSVSKFVAILFASSSSIEHILIGQFCIMCSTASAVTVRSTIRRLREQTES
jgi:hypothetical protein